MLSTSTRPALTDEGPVHFLGWRSCEATERHQGDRFPEGTAPSAPSPGWESRKNPGARSEETGGRAPGACGLGALTEGHCAFGSAPACGSKEENPFFLFRGFAPLATHLSALQASLGLKPRPRMFRPCGPPGIYTPATHVSALRASVAAVAGERVSPEEVEAVKRTELKRDPNA